MLDGGIPSASRAEDLPGFIVAVVRRLLRPLFFHHRIFVIFLLILLIVPSEGCLPGWFRHQRSSHAALEGTETTRTIEDNVPKTYVSGTKYEPPEEEVEYIDEDEDENELAGPYGTASPIKHDPKLEEYRQAFMESECEGWCYSGGNCTVHVHPTSYAFMGKHCKCPPDFMGARCEEHYVKTLYSSIKGPVQYEKSAVPALAFLFMMVVVAVGLAVYSYRKITRRSDFSDFSTSVTMSTEYYLRRSGGVYSSRSPFSPRMTPRGGPAQLNKYSPLLLEGGQITMLPTTSLATSPNSTQVTQQNTSNTMSSSRTTATTSPPLLVKSKSSPNYSVSNTSPG